jgi:plastocyanin
METETRNGAETESERRTPRRGRWPALLVVIVLLGAIGLAVRDMVGQSDREHARVVGGVAYASITTRDFGYVPALVLADRTRTVRVTIHNQGLHTHTFVIDSLGVDALIPRGATEHVTLHLPRGGRFYFYCRFHQQFGMRGHLVVTD